MIDTMTYTENLKESIAKLLEIIEFSKLTGNNPHTKRKFNLFISY